MTANSDPTNPSDGGILSILIARAEEKGDLPVFNASISRVRKISSDPNSHAMALAQTIMKDVNLSTKVLRIANSSFYNRGQGKIGSLSRGVVLLGFDTIKSLCLTLKMIESFQDNHPQIGMKQLVARSYLTAGFVREVAIQAGGAKEAEETYLCGLFRDLGEICVAYFLPHKFIELLELQKSGVPWMAAQERVLGMSLVRIGQQLASYWNFSSKSVSAMREYDPSTAGPVRNKDQLRHAIVALCGQIINGLYVDRGNRSDMASLFSYLSQATGVQVDRLEQTLNESFQVACDLAKEYGLSTSVLDPVVVDSSDPLRDKYAHEFSFLATRPAMSSEPAASQNEGPSAIAGRGSVREVSATLASAGPGAIPAAVPAVRATATPDPKMIGQTVTPSELTPLTPPINAANAAPVSVEQSVTVAKPIIVRGDPNIQLAIIQEITAMVTEQVSLNMLFVKILEGLHRGVGFDRAMLCLISPDRSQYAGRIALGKDSESLKAAVCGTVNEKKDLFSRVLLEGSDLFIEDTRERGFAEFLSTAFREHCSATQVIVAGIRTTTRRPLGFFYVDNATSGEPVTADLQRGFMQFIAQARLAVRVRG